MSDEETPIENENTLTDMLPDNWRDVLPDDLKANGVLSGVTSLSQMAKMTVDARQYGSNSIRIPSEDATDDDRQTFITDIMQKVPTLMIKPDIDNQDAVKQVMKSLGAPDDVSGYDMAEVPEGIKSSMDNLSEKALNAGLTKNQFSEITSGILDDYKANSEQVYGAQEEEANKLKSDWGAAYDQKVETISHFAKQTGFSEEFVGAIKNGAVDATNMKAFDNVIKGYEGEAIEIGRQATNPEVIMTPQEADSRLNELMGNKDHAFWHPENPEHEAAKKKVLELGELAETGQKSDADKFREALMGNG